MPRYPNLKAKTARDSDGVESSLSEGDQTEREASGADESKKPSSYRFSQSQRSRVFACICVARHLHNASDSDEYFNRDIYETTLDLLKPHLADLQLNNQPPPYNAVRKLWIEFVRTGLVNRVPGSKDKTYHKGLKLSRDENILNNDEKGRKKESGLSYTIAFLCCLTIMMLYFLKISAQGPVSNQPDHSWNANQINFNRVDEINQKFPDLLAPKKLRTIKMRLAKMMSEVSILMLLGSARDEHCKEDPTFCVGIMIANSSDSLPCGYINAADPKLTTRKLIGELSHSFDNNRRIDRNGVVIIDSLNSLPGNEVMNLFQFIDRDEYKKRHGLLLLIVYTDNQAPKDAKVKDAELVEQVLVRQWSSHVPRDKLTSVISRMSGTIIKTH
jgi:hypothetical protein